VLFFTDGEPTCPAADAESAARLCKDHGATITAVATGDARVDFLEKLVGDRARVFWADAGQFGDAFKSASKIISGETLMQRTPEGGGAFWRTIRTSGWSSLLALGLSLALIAGQNVYLRRPFLTAREAGAGALGGLAAGAVGGAVGFLVFSPFAGVAFLSAIGALIGWCVLGALVGEGMALFVPNLSPSRAWLGGSAGGGIGAMSFLLLSNIPAVGDVLGRLIGAAILGLAIGLLIAIVEIAFRKAWLEVSYGPKETIHVNLGADRVSVGSDSKACKVFAFGTAPVALQYRIVGDEVECEDVVSGTKTIVQPGDKRSVGGVSVTVRSAAP
jgi:Ca-activated chloride channel family protein